jgi:hypothetical protein
LRSRGDWGRYPGTFVCISASVLSMTQISMTGRNVETLAFEFGSRLCRIERRAFSNRKSLNAICIPASVDEIDSEAFDNIQILLIAVDQGNPHFSSYGYSLMDYEGTSLIRSFVCSREVIIDCDIETGAVICEIRERALDSKCYIRVRFGSL